MTQDEDEFNEINILLSELLEYKDGSMTSTEMVGDLIKRLHTAHDTSYILVVFLDNIMQQIKAELKARTES